MSRHSSKIARLLHTGASIAALTCIAGQAHAGIYRDDVGDEGSQDYAADWDGVVQIYLLDNLTGSILFNCTGSMVNARTVLSAAHCFNDLPAEAYGPDTRYTPIVAYGPDTIGTPGAPGPLLNYLQTGQQFMDDRNGLSFGVDLITHPDADPGFGDGAVAFPGADVAMIALQDPLYTLPTYAMLFSPVPSEEFADGIHVTQVGYGTYGPGSSTGIGINGKRRAGENMLGLLASQNDFFQALSQDEDVAFEAPGDNQLLYWTDFDLPDREENCEREDYFGFEKSIVCDGATTGVLVGPDTAVLPDETIDWLPGDALPNEFGTAGGDSGGPLFADELAGMPLILGVLSGGFVDGTFSAPGQTYGDLSYYNPLFTYHQFISENNPYKYVSATAGDGLWSDPMHWVQTLDPNYMIYDADGNLVNGLPDGDEGGLGQRRPVEGIAFDTPVDEYDTADDDDGVEPPDEEEGLRTIADSVTDTASDAFTGISLGGGSGSVTNNASDATAVDGSQSPHVVSATPAAISSITGIDQSLTGPGSTNFVPDNFYGARGEAFVAPAQFFEVTLSANGTTTLDMNAEIDKLTVDGPGAALDIDSDYQLVSNINAEVFDGLLNVDGQLLTREAVIWGGALTGSGEMFMIDLNQLYGNGNIMSGTVFNVAGTVSGGTLDSVGTLSINGDYVQTAAGLLLANIRGGESDLLAITGSASLDGTLGLDFGMLPSFGDSFTVLTATGDIVGSFSNTASPQLVGVLYGETTVEDGAVTVEIDAEDFVDFLAETGTDNQLSIGRALDMARMTSYDELGGVYGVVDYLAPRQLGNALNLLAPDEAIFANNAMLAMGENGMKRILEGSAKAKGGTFKVASNAMPVSGSEVRLATATNSEAMTTLASTMQETGGQTSFVMDEAWAGFADITLSEGDVGGLTEFEEAAFSGFSLSAGLERMLTDTLSLGVVATYNEGDTEAGNGSGADVDGYSANVYAKKQFDALSVTAFAGIGHYDIETMRSDAVFGPVTMTEGETGADQVSAGVDVSYHMALAGGIHLAPHAGLYFAEYEVGGYAETGGAAALDVDKYDFKTFQARLGGKIFSSHEKGEMTIRPFGSVDVVKDMAEDRQAIYASFSVERNAPFYVMAEEENDGAWVEPSLGVEIDRGETATFSASVSTMAGRDSVEIYNLQVGGTFRF